MTSTAIERPLLAPIRKTSMRRRFTRSGLTERLECWAAMTLDGKWSFEREDSPGTPWLVYSTETGEDAYTLPVTLLSSLRACRAYVASGNAQAALDRIQAHRRGEHAEQRDARCRRC